MTNTTAAATPSAYVVATGSSVPAKNASTTVEDSKDNNHDCTTSDAGY